MNWNGWWPRSTDRAPKHSIKFLASNFPASTRRLGTFPPTRLATLLVGILLASLPVTTSLGQPPITAVAIAPDDGTIVAVSQAGVVRYRLPELAVVGQSIESAPNLHCVAFSPSGSLLAVGGGYPAQQGTIDIFDWPSMSTRRQIQAHQDSVMDTAWRDESTLISVGLDRQVFRWDLATDDEPASLTGHSAGVTAVCLVDDRALLISGGIDHSLRVWEVATGNLIRSLAIHTRPITALKSQPHAAGLPMIASASEDRTIRFWQPTIGRMVRFVRLDSVPLCIAWTPGGESVVVGCADGNLRVVDPVTVQILATVPAIDGWVYAVAIDSQGTFAVAAGERGQLVRVPLPSTQ
jgi:WD40 repeat protein